jgi:hypothetical protein
MALEIDGFAVLGSIAKHPSRFADVRADAAKAARALVAAQIKSRATGLASLRGIRDALGAPAFDLILDGLPDAQVKTLVGKLDKNHPELKGAALPWLRQHLRALADASMEPAALAKKPSAKPKAAKEPAAAKKAGAKKDEPLQRLNYSSAGATRKR